jgi:hypothetical protein
MTLERHDIRDEKTHRFVKAERIKTVAGTIPNEPPVTREQGESVVMWGKRRKTQIRRWYRDGIDPAVIASIHGTTKRYVNDTLGIRSPGYQWVAPQSVLDGPFPSLEEAKNEVALTTDEPGRLTTEQAIQRAVQMYRWHMAGMTLRQIGEKFGLSKERVRTVLDKFGLARRWGPKWKTGVPPELPEIRDEVAGSAWTNWRRVVKVDDRGATPWWMMDDYPEGDGLE